MIWPEADRILARAREVQPAWAEVDVSSRSAILSRLRHQIAIECESIANCIADEVSKPLLDALSGDVLVTLELMRYYEARGADILRPREVGKPSLLFRGARFETRFEPHGVALIFGPSNYPFQLAMIPLFSALTAGNAVVLKCSERTPRVAELIAKLCARADLPPNLVQVLHVGPEESAALIESKPDLIFFTGGSAHGRMVAERAARHLIPTLLELGGKDASIVFADCHLERAVEGITYGAFSNGGRVCIGVKRAYIESSVFDEFVVRLRERIKNLRVSADPDADLCPITGELFTVLRAQVEDALARGARLQYPGDRERMACEPTLLSDVPTDSRLLLEESFGPVLCIAPFRDEAHAISLANSSAFALSSSVWTGDRARAHRVATRLSAGSCAVNDVIRVIANPQAPFGGNGLSGYGRYHGTEGLCAFSRIKTIMVAADRQVREINWFPSNDRTRHWLARLLRFRHGPNSLVARLSRLFIPPLLVAVLCGSTVAQSQTRLTVDVNIDGGGHGDLGYLIFDSPSGFPDVPAKAVRKGFIPIPAGAQHVQIDVDLSPGSYAVSVYEDLNGNHKLDRNLLGIPREPVGASNNPHPHMGPPRFSDCSFRVSTVAKTISINLVRAS